MSAAAWRSLPVVLPVALILLLQAEQAGAYIDPGTGSALFYAVTAIIVSVYFSARGLYYKAVEYVFRVRHRDQRCDVAIHCEDPRYEITFLPVMRAMRERGAELTFFTRYQRDASFEPLPEGVEHRAIAPGIVGYAYLNHIEARLLVTTTPQLDVMTFRRSRRVRHYAHIQHALGESRYVRPFAYDYYDSILCCGPIMKANLRRMEAIRGSRIKDLYETGIPHYEELLRSRRAAPEPGSDTVVLVAPSWGPLSMFEAFGTAFVREIARRYRVIVRPHPQMKLSQPDLYREILGIEGVTVDTQRTPADAMSKAHVLLSDISGISHEFAFIYERPVVIIDRKMSAGGLEGELLGGDSELKERCAEFIVPVQPTEMPNIVEHLSRAMAMHSRRRLAEVRSELVYNFGSASVVAADQLMGILSSVDAERRAQAGRTHRFWRRLAPKSQA
jgi:hypothetical protein